MSRIYKAIELAKEQYNMGLISKDELSKMLRGYEIDLMGCDSL